CLHHFRSRGALVGHKLPQHHCRRRRAQLLRFYRQQSRGEVEDADSDDLDHSEYSGDSETEYATTASDVPNSPPGETQRPDGDGNASSMSEAMSDADRGSDTSDDSVESDDEERHGVRDNDNFDTLYEFFRFIASCNGGRGLTDESTAWLLSILNDPRCDVSRLQQWRSKRAVKQPHWISLATQTTRTGLSYLHNRTTVVPGESIQPQRPAPTGRKR
ncbi:unnamed protein product, partial [Closterium sp. Naga37s-1]